MYVATPPATEINAPADPTPVGQIPLPLARIITRTFDKGQPYSEGALRIVEDLAASYGVPYSRDDFAARRRTTFTDMVKVIADELTDEGEPVGLVVLAHGTADAEPQWPACYLSYVLPGQPLSFAVADTGAVTPFVAMRIAAEYIKADKVRRAAVVILEQVSLLQDPSAGSGPPLPDENRLVALIFDRDGALGSASVRTTPGVTAGTAEDTLRGRIDGDGGAVVVGGGLAASAEDWGGPGVAVAVAGMPSTGPWVALLEGLERWRSAGARRVTVMDYDRPMELLGECVIELGARPSQ